MPLHASPQRRLGLLATLLFGCSAAPTPAASARPQPVAAPQPHPVERVPNTSTTKPTPVTGPKPIVLLTDAADLDPLRERLALGALVFNSDARTTKGLRASPSYRSFAESLGEGFRKWWIGHPRTEFELVAVVNRLDRMDMAPQTCGETRVIYRLVHNSNEGVPRRLPLALNVVFTQQDDGASCATVAKSWMRQHASELTAADGPLSREKISISQMLSIESNARSEDSNILRIHRLREPETGHRSGRWRDGILEFEPRAMFKGNGWKTVAKIITEPQMRAAIAQGVPVTRSHTSGYSPWFEGNGGWDRVMDHIPEDAELSPFQSKSAFLDRVSSLTCSGCHLEGRSVGGFHLPGDGATSQLHGAASAHLLREIPWRQAYVQAVAEGRAPNRNRQSVDGTDPIPAVRAGESCESGDTCLPQPTSKDMQRCRFDRDPYACARDKTKATRAQACETQADCPAQYACATIDETTGCYPALALGELNVAGHEAAVR